MIKLRSKEDTLFQRNTDSITIPKLATKKLWSREFYEGPFAVYERVLVYPENANGT